jgi:hypothetical protein
MFFVQRVAKCGLILAFFVRPGFTRNFCSLKPLIGGAGAGRRQGDVWTDMVVSKGGKTRVVVEAEGEGELRPRKATLSVLSVSPGGGGAHTVVELRLSTGRLHQIRVQVCALQRCKSCES